jgi:multimeric flavodoxin WrbA
LVKESGQKKLYTRPITILVLSAGTNEKSNSLALAEAFVKGVQTIAGSQAEILRLKDMSIRHFDLEHYKPACSTEDDFCRLQEKFLEADGVVIATPIWNFSVPAHLKNVIDRLGAVALDAGTHSRGQLKGKPFFLIFTGGAPMIAWKALMHLTLAHVSEAFKYYGGIVIGRHFEPKCMVRRGTFGFVMDKRPGSLATLERRGAAFAKIATAYKERGKLPPWIRLRYWFFTQAYRIGNRVMYPVSSMQ